MTLSLGARVSVRSKILLVGAVGVIAALVVGLIGVGNARTSEANAHETQRLSRLLSAVKQINFYNADVTGWQLAYAWDTRPMDPAEAIDPESPNRAGYLASIAGLRAELDAMPVETMNAEERADYDRIVEL